jgi:ABC-type transport system involved in cytochrome c biogenesis permease subunit
LAETRLWYSFFLSLIGYFAYKLLKLRWFWLYAMAMSALFLSINLAKPETFDKSLMPALQSVWFVPHVVVYIIAYAFLAGSSAGAVYAIWMRVRGKKEDTILGDLDVIVYAGFGFLTLGLIFGALWAKTAWGHYWTWDPKETWALMTWLMYLLYIHIRVQHKSRVGLQQWMLALSCIVLMLCWFGVNYLPSTQNSIHVYSQE